MIKIEFLKLDWQTTLLRYYLLMAVIIVAGFSGYWAIAFLALPIFISAILGVRFSRKQTRRLGKVIAIHNKKEQKKAI